jgi:hypothetical protein
VKCVICTILGLSLGLLIDISYFTYTNKVYIKNIQNCYNITTNTHQIFNNDITDCVNSLGN